jgi:hypothetical protein
MKKFLAVTAIIGGLAIGSVFVGAEPEETYPEREVSHQLPANAPDFDAPVTELPADEVPLEIRDKKGNIVWKGKQGDFVKNQKEIRKLIKEKTRQDL